MAAFTGPLGLYIPRTEFQQLPRQSQSKILANLTVRAKKMPGAPKHAKPRVAQAYKNVEIDGQTYIVVPPTKRAIFAQLGLVAAPPEVPRGIPQGALAQALTDVPLYAYQQAAVEFLVQALAHGTPEHSQQVYLKMATGLGKTRVGATLAMVTKVVLGQPTVVVLPSSKGIREQWRDEFFDTFPDLRVVSYSNAKLGAERGARYRMLQRHECASADVVLIIVNTARNKPPEFFHAGQEEAPREGAPHGAPQEVLNPGLLILDEAHEFHSEKNCEVLWNTARVPRKLGLSATPDEKPDGIDAYVKHFLGPVQDAEDIPGFDTAEVNFRGIVLQVYYQGEPENLRQEALAGTAIKRIGVLIRDRHRLRCLAAIQRWLYDLHEHPQAKLLGLGPRPPEESTEKYPAGEIRRHESYLFAEHRDYLPAFREALLEYFREDELLVVGDEQGAARTIIDETRVLRGGATRDDLAAAREARVVATTYGYSRRGISMTNKTALTQGTPRRNGMMQLTGRVERRGSDESVVRIFVDLVDVGSALRSQKDSRLRVYREKGYAIYRTHVSWEDFQEPGAPLPGNVEPVKPRGNAGNYPAPDPRLVDLPRDLFQCVAERA